MSDSTQNKTKSQVGRAKKPATNTNADNDLITVIKALVKANEDVLADNAKMRSEMNELQSIKALLIKTVPFIHESITAAEAVKEQALKALSATMEEAQKIHADAVEKREQANAILIETRSLVTEMSQTVAGVVDAAKTDIQNMSDNAVKVLNIALDRSVEARAAAEKSATQKIEGAVVHLSEEISSMASKIEIVGTYSKRMETMAEYLAKTLNSMESASRDTALIGVSVAGQMQHINESMPVMQHLANQIAQVSESVKAIDKVADMMTDVLSVTAASDVGG